MVLMVLTDFEFIPKIPKTKTCCNLFHRLRMHMFESSSNFGDYTLDINTVCSLDNDIENLDSLSFVLWQYSIPLQVGLVEFHCPATQNEVDAPTKLKFSLHP